MEKPTVAIFGASGIGKHHAKWFHFGGCNVVAFVGTSPDSCQKTEKALREIFPFQGRWYTDIGRMLEECGPQLVSVCTPSHLHGEHVIRALEAGSHVLCEKPLFWDPSRSTREQLSLAEKMLEVQSRTGRFAVNLQFAASVAPYRQVYRHLSGAEIGRVRQFYMHWTPRAGGAPRTPEWYWNDLGPHALSILLSLAPTAGLIHDSIDCQVFPEGTETRFFVRTDQGDCSAHIRLTAPVEGKVVREYGANGRIVRYSSEPDGSGQFRSYLAYEDRKWDFEDFMKRSIERFVASAAFGDGEPYVDGRQAFKNLQMQLEIFDRARRTN